MSLVLILSCLLCFSYAFADDVHQVEEIQVRAKKKISHFNFYKSETIDSLQLEGEPSGLIAPQLIQIPGVIANQNGGPGGRVSYFMRGTESRHVSFTLDGMKLNDPSNTDRQFDSAFFSVPFLREVEIHKGPQAVLYGSDALGGLIEMTSRKGENSPETRIGFNGGSFGTFDSFISNDWKTNTNESRGTLTAYRFHTDGISRLNKKRFKAKERDASDITQITSASNHKWTSQLDTDFLFSYLRGENELDGATDDNSHDVSKNDQYIAQQKTNLQFSKSTALSLRNGFNRHQRNLDTLTSGKESYEGDLIQNEAIHAFQKDRLHLMSGLATEHEQFENNGVDRSFDLHSVFVQSALKFSHFKIQSGGRAEKHIRYGSFYTGSGGLSYAYAGHLLSLQYSQGYKAPSLYQLYAPPSYGYAIGNSNLVPEVNHSWEGTWNFKQPEFETGITLFQNRLSNLITFSTTQGYLNQSRFIAEGVELSTKIKRKTFHIFTNLTHQEFRKQETVVLRRPLNNLQTGFSVFPTEKSEASLKGRFYSSRKDYDENGNTIKLNGYEVFDLGFRYFFKNIDLGLQIINIMNRPYEELYGYSVMPRSVFFHSGFVF